MTLFGNVSISSWVGLLALRLVCGPVVGEEVRESGESGSLLEVFFGGMISFKTDV